MENIEKKIEEKTESPLEIAQKLAQETKTNLEAMRIEREAIEKAFANLAISGRSIIPQTPKEKTQSDIAREKADQMVSKLLK